MLPLRILESLAGFFLAVLFALFHAGIPHKKACRLKRFLYGRVQFHRCARYAEAKRSCLSALAAAFYIGPDVIFTQKLRQIEYLPYSDALRLCRKICVE